MTEATFTHILAFAGVFARGADIVSTRLVTPRLALESNLLMRRLGWRGAWATLLLGLVAYWSRELAVVIITASFLVAGSNLLRGWFARFLGEFEVERLMTQAVRRGRLRVAVAFVCGGGLCIALAGGLCMWLSGATQWGYYTGMGIVVYGLAVAVHGSINVARLFRKAAELAA